MKNLKGWVMADFKSVLQDNINAFFKDKVVGLDLLTELCKMREAAEKALFKAAEKRLQYDCAVPKSVMINHEKCAEDFNYKNGLVWRCINILNGQSYE